MSDPSLSYLLLTYNQRETVKAAVQSALAQNVQPMEIIISDDCSADDTFAEAKSAVANYQGPHRIILNRNPKNLGLIGNLDKAHELCSGDVIIAAAGDDISHPQRSQRILETFVTQDPLLVCSYANVIDQYGDAVPGNFKTALYYRDNWDLKRAARSKSLYIGATGAWRRSLYTDHGPIDPASYEDLVLGFRAALLNRVATIREELVQYRLGTGIVGSDGFDTNTTAFETRRIGGFMALQAIMRQRIQDAKHFGLKEQSPILRILQREQIRAELGLAFYRDRKGAFRRHSLRHPILGLHTMHSERRRIRKVMRKLQTQTS